MSNQFLSALEFFMVVFSELAILFIAISFIVSLVNQKLPTQKVKRLLSGNRGYAIAVGLGAVTPFCSCSTLPMTIGLLQARAAFGSVMAFLITSPLLNPFIVGLFWVSFGPKITLIYAVFVLAFAVISGVLLEKFNFSRFIRKEVFLSNDKTHSSVNQCQQTDCETASKETLRWSRLLVETVRQFISFVPYMALGVAVGAILHGYVPESAFTNLSGQNILLLIPLTAFIGVFLYVRASTMVPIATSLAAKGMAMGAVMSLTIAGAGASLPEMIMMKKMFQWPLLLAFVFVVFTTACMTGFAIELL